MTNPTETPIGAWPAWLDGLAPDERVNAIVQAVANCYSLGQKGHEAAEPGEQHCTAAMAEVFLVRVLDEARAEPAAVPSAEQDAPEPLTHYTTPGNSRLADDNQPVCEAPYWQLVSSEVRHVTCSGCLTRLGQVVTELPRALADALATIERLRSAVPVAEMGDLRDRINVALGASLDRCTRCKVCESQLDAVMTIAGPLASQLAVALQALHRLASGEVMFSERDMVDAPDPLAAERAARAAYVAGTLATIGRVADEQPEPAGAAEPEPEPVAPLPPGDYGRMELPGFRSHTGWWRPGVLAGQSVMVCMDREGNAVAEYIPGPASRFVRLPVPSLAAPGPERPALGWAADEEDDDPDEWAGHRPNCHDETCDGECQERPTFS